MVARTPVILFLGATTLMLAHPPLAAAQGGSLAIDDRGFIGTDARCDDSTEAVAFGRTQRSLVAICADGSRYEYRAVRLNDEASLAVPAESTGDSEFSAANEGVTYRFSAKELVVATDDRVLRTEPMVAYVEPRQPDEE